MNFNWLGKAGRKYSIQIFLTIAATAALFTGFCSFIQWGAYTGTIFAGYGFMNHQAKKLEK